MSTVWSEEIDPILSRGMFLDYLGGAELGLGS